MRTEKSDPLPPLRDRRQKEYRTDLNNTMKESTKRLSASTVYYYKSEKSSWYPDPEHDIPLSQLPSIPQLANAKLSHKAVEEVWSYALTYIWICRKTKIKLPGARFSKLPVITWPVKLFCFPFQMGVSKGLKIVP